MIPQPIILFLPWLAGALATWLVSAKLTQVFNGLIIAFFFVGSVALCYFTGGQLSGDYTANLSLIIGYSAAIFGLMKPLMDFLGDKLPSPLVLLAQGIKVTPTTPPQGGNVIAPPPPNKL